MHARIITLTYTHEICRQFPTWFEFNERFFLFLADNVYSCRFGTFLYNSHKERRERDVQNRTVSIWVHVEEHLELYRNQSYSSVESVLIPRYGAMSFVMFLLCTRVSRCHLGTAVIPRTSSYGRRTFAGSTLDRTSTRLKSSL